MTEPRDPKTVGVTGSSRGIGAAIALELARRGYTVACLNRNGQATPVPKDFPAEARARLVGIACDVINPDSVRHALGQCARLGGGLFGIVNNAGIARGGPSRTFSLEAFNEVFQTNVVGVFSVCQAAYPFLAEQGGGLIVNVGSFWDRIGGKAYVAYCASKAAVAAVSRALAVEWAKQGIRVLDVAPGYVTTEMTADYLKQEAMQAHLAKRIPRGYAGEPHEIAKLVAALYAEDIGYLTGSTIYIDGAQGVAP